MTHEGTLHYNFEKRVNEIRQEDGKKAVDVDRSDGVEEGDTSADKDNSGKVAGNIDSGVSAPKDNPLQQGLKSVGEATKQFERATGVDAPDVDVNEEIQERARQVKEVQTETQKAAKDFGAKAGSTLKNFQQSGTLGKYDQKNQKNQKQQKQKKGLNLTVEVRVPSTRKIPKGTKVAVAVAGVPGSARVKPVSGGTASFEYPNISKESRVKVRAPGASKVYGPLKPGEHTLSIGITGAPKNGQGQAGQQQSQQSQQNQQQRSAGGRGSRGARGRRGGRGRRGARGGGVGVGTGGTATARTRGRGGQQQSKGGSEVTLSKVVDAVQQQGIGTLPQAAMLYAEDNPLKTVVGGAAVAGGAYYGLGVAGVI